MQAIFLTLSDHFWHRGMCLKEIPMEPSTMCPGISSHGMAVCVNTILDLCYCLLGFLSSSFHFLESLYFYLNFLYILSSCCIVASCFMCNCYHNDIFFKVCMTFLDVEAFWWNCVWIELITCFILWGSVCWLWCSMGSDARLEKAADPAFVAIASLKKFSLNWNSFFLIYKKTQ